MAHDRGELGIRTSNGNEVAAERWDAVIIGTGIGGATLGYALAAAGWRVLFCEKGLAAGGNALVGDYAEKFFTTPANPGPEHAAVLRRAGRYVEQLEDSPTAHLFIPFIGSGSGGSSALYGMVMERFFPADFLPGKYHPSVTNATHPAEWPIGYEELAKYYSDAETLYRVRGGRDPLRPDLPDLMPAPALSPAAERLAKHFSARGLHPYRLPAACEFVDKCQSCQGYLCPRDCKNDATRICLAPAVENHGAALIDGCEVVRLRGSRRSVEAVECLWRGEPLVIRGRLVVLAAGALGTPAVLLRSESEDWPRGLANDSGLVGRNLMRHAVTLYVVEPLEREGLDNRPKELGLNDFYVRVGVKLGSLQSFGRLPPPEIVWQSLLQDIREGPFRLSLPLLRLAKSGIRKYLDRLIDRHQAFAAILEDLPYADNRIEPSRVDGRIIRMNYRMQPYERERNARFRTAIADAFGPLRYRIIDQAQKNERVAHACGTCRFGGDSRTSVLDRNCRAHGLDNLYVVDSSFFPTSSGTNPSLTIAANALRVAASLATPRTMPLAPKEAS